MYEGPDIKAEWVPVIYNHVWSFIYYVQIYPFPNMEELNEYRKIKTMEAGAFPGLP